MSTSTTQNQMFQHGLNIHLIAFFLPKDIIKEKEQIRVSITTMPDETKQHFSIKGKLMDYTNHLFSLNITNQTEKIIIVFRKKTLLKENPIIASTTINLKDFKEMPNEQIKEGIIETDVKSFNLYYPLQKQIREEHQQNVKRTIIGNMKIKLSFTTPFSHVKQDKVCQKSKNNNNQNKSHKTKRNSKKIEEYNELNDSDDCFSALLIN